MASVHLIGHGMGAHAASYTGERVKVDDEECLNELATKNNGKDSGTWWQLPSWLSTSKAKVSLSLFNASLR